MNFWPSGPLILQFRLIKNPDAREVFPPKTWQNQVSQIWEGYRKILHAKSFRLVPLSPQMDITKLKIHQFKVWRDTWKMSAQITKIQFFPCFCHPTAKRPRILPDLRSKNLLVRVSLRNSFKSGKSTLNPFFLPFQTFYTKTTPTVTCAIPRSIGFQNSGSEWLNPAMFSVSQSDACIHQSSGNNYCTSKLLTDQNLVSFCQIWMISRSLWSQLWDLYSVIMLICNLSK